jgi:hypothetical protein
MDQVKYFYKSATDNTQLDNESIDWLLSIAQSTFIKYIESEKIQNITKHVDICEIVRYAGESPNWYICLSDIDRNILNDNLGYNFVTSSSIVVSCDQIMNKIINEIEHKSIEMIVIEALSTRCIHFRSLIYESYDTYITERIQEHKNSERVYIDNLCRVYNVPNYDTLVKTAGSGEITQSIRSHIAIVYETLLVVQILISLKDYSNFDIKVVTSALTHLCDLPQVATDVLKAITTIE